LKISYVTTYNASDVHGWSGLGWHLSRALLDQQAEMDYIGDLNVEYGKTGKAKEYIYRLLGYRYLRNREMAVVKGFAGQVAKRMDPTTDIILSPGTLPIAYLNTKKPKVFYTDATFAGMLGFYDSFTDLCPESIKIGHQIEQEALSSCSLAIYSSDWAAQTAIENYKIHPDKIKVVPFGANIERYHSLEDIKEMIRQRSGTVCKLLFLGVEWERKGGDMAMGIAKRLNEAGLRTELHIAGIRSFPFPDLPEYVTDHGFISKSSPEGRNKIENLIAGSHFLVLPVKAEAYGLVFCEANSFAVPAIATNVGGIPTIIKDNVNGRLFPLSATMEDYADYILDLFTDYARYKDLALSSFNEFEKRLNWKVSGKKVIELLKTV
jgi:glycosyltransferase involved in cell wall biosynthesis